MRDGAGSFLRHFADLVPVLPVHAAGNPPGLLLSMDALGIDTAQGLAALTIVVGALATPLLYLLARRLLGEQLGRVAALLFVFVPTSLLYGATSADAMYVSFGVLAALLLVSQRRWVLILGAARPRRRLLLLLRPAGDRRLGGDPPLAAAGPGGGAAAGPALRRGAASPSTSPSTSSAASTWLR